MDGPMQQRLVRFVGLIPLCLITALAWGQTPSQRPRSGRAERHVVLRPGLFFEEVWKRPPGTSGHAGRGGLNVALTGKANSNPELDLKVYAPGGAIRLVAEGSTENGNNPLHLWTGLCTSACAVAFRDKRHYADLSGLARIRFNTKMSGFHHIRPIVELADGTWWVGDQEVGSTRDWLVSEISFAALHWLKLAMPQVVTRGNLVDKIDLSKVDQIGFVDLKAGSGHGPGGAADVGQIEVYGRAVARTGQD